MAKLNKEKAAATEAAESRDFSALPAGVYHCKLREVQTERAGQPLTGASGPYWIWVWDVRSPEKYVGRRLFLNTSLSEGALWKLKQVYTALGYTTDSDTDEMVGEMATLTVSTRVQEQGQRAGQLSNNVDNVGEFTGPAELAEVDSAGAVNSSGVKF